MPATVDYQLYKIPAGTKPWHPLNYDWIDGVEADMKLSATEAWVLTQIATGGVDVSTFATPHDIITANTLANEFSSEPHAPIEILKQNIFEGGMI